jgi:hypothetical protein
MIIPGEGASTVPMSMGDRRRVALDGLVVLELAVWREMRLPPQVVGHAAVAGCGCELLVAWGERMWYKAFSVVDDRVPTRRV